MLSHVIVEDNIDNINVQYNNAGILDFLVSILVSSTVILEHFIIDKK